MAPGISPPSIAVPDSDVFVTNVLNGTVAAGGAVVNRGTVVRLVLHTAGSAAPWVVSSTVVGSGFAERTDPAALVVGPTGDAVNAAGTLFVADTADNRLAAIPDAFSRTSSALTGADVTSNGWLNAPLGMALAPNGDILTVKPGMDGSWKRRLRRAGGVPVPRHERLTARERSPLRPRRHSQRHGVYFVDDATNTFGLLH